MPVSPSRATQALISEILKLEGITAQFAADEKAAHVKLKALQKKRIEALLKPEAIAPASTDVRSAAQTVTELNSTVAACKAKSAELVQQILGSMQADTRARTAELSGQVVSLERQEQELLDAYLEAMASAALAQMAYLGWWDKMRTNGPAFGRLEQSAQRVFAAKMDELCAREGINSASKPISDRIKLVKGERAGLREPLSVTHVEAEIEEARRVQARIANRLNLERLING
ncbi:MAG: hypothetical protein WB930_13820 [Syntrophobacteraceae bacterium]